ncbi:hypothetical protein CRENBAI_014559 [Crenichthys baileyi]|uniref:Uncharacterized protein n=1 Tax=Crenichthys baileyi TaxID=28760 RepID=A0AAV9SQ31_9TELE
MLRKRCPGRRSLKKRPHSTSGYEAVGGGRSIGRTKLHVTGDAVSSFSQLMSERKRRAQHLLLWSAGTRLSDLRLDVSSLQVPTLQCYFCCKVQAVNVSLPLPFGLRNSDTNET